jgi:glycosyltransferase involved in cell wall biosynthesis
MLSILIPIYNFDVYSLVQCLYEQGLKTGVSFEIIGLDDCSAASYQSKNRLLRAFPLVHYEELPHNVGRSKIRNLLAEKAKYEYLLFMDCDSAIANAEYLSVYLAYLQPGQLLYGGRIYNTSSPTDARYKLHWTYGITREQQRASNRRKQPYHSFMTNNFLVPREELLSIRFSEKLKGYGHEDTLFGFELMKNNIPIVHLDNPLIHVGLEDSDTFLAKSKVGIQNLYRLEQMPDVFIETRLLKVFRLVNKGFLTSFLFAFLASLESVLIAQLKGKRPNMRAFDLLKLYWLLQESKK